MMDTLDPRDMVTLIGITSGKFHDGVEALASMDVTTEAYGRVLSNTMASLNAMFSVTKVMKKLVDTLVPSDEDKGDPDGDKSGDKSEA